MKGVSERSTRVPSTRKGKALLLERKTSYNSTIGRMAISWPSSAKRGSSYVDGRKKICANRKVNTFCSFTLLRRSGQKKKTLSPSIKREKYSFVPVLGEEKFYINRSPQVHLPLSLGRGGADFRDGKRQRQCFLLPPSVELLAPQKGES